MKNKLVDIIYQSLCQYRGEYDQDFGNVTIGGDHKSSEVIITLFGGDGEQNRDFVISNNDIREIE